MWRGERVVHRARHRLVFLNDRLAALEATRATYYASVPTTPGASDPYAGEIDLTLAEIELTAAATAALATDVAAARAAALQRDAAAVRGRLGPQPVAAPDAAL